MSEGYIKNLGQVAAVVFSETAPVLTKILWFDLNENILKIYSKDVNSWVPLVESIKGALNLEGEGEGLVFKELTDSVLKFRRIKGGVGVEVSTNSTDVTISLGTFLEGSPNPLNFDSSIGSENTFTISSNTSWKLIIPPELVSVESGWLEFDKTSGYGYSEVKISVTKLNPSSTSRSSTFLLKDMSGKLEDIEFTVTQVGEDIYVGSYIQKVNDFICEEI